MIFPNLHTEMLCRKSFSKTTEKDNINFEYGKVYKITHYGRSYYNKTDQFEDMWYIRSLYDNGSYFMVSHKGIEYLYKKGYLVDNK